MSVPFADATIIFDLDGTLIDTAPDLAQAANVALAAEGRPPISVADLRPLVGKGARALIERGLAHTGGPVTAARLEALVAVFLEHYSAHIADDSQPFPGVLDAIERLRSDGAAIAICTNKQEGLSRQLLDALGLTARFDAIIGRDTTAERKPSGMPVREAAIRAGRAPDRGLMIGDTTVDVGAAKAAGIPVVVVRFGYADAALEAMGADALIAHYDELYDTARALLTPS